MATYTFDDDSIASDTGEVVLGIPGSQQIPANGTTLTIPLTNSTTALTFNPFLNVDVTDGTAGGNSVVFRLAFADTVTTIGSANGSLLYSGGGFTGTLAFGQNVSFSGTAAQAQEFLRSVQIVTNSTTDVFSIQLQGRNEGGTSVSTRTYSYRVFVACYQQGTLIGTPAGERPVEMLRAGDLVTTLDGSAKTVKWVGHRTYEAEFGATEAFVRPVVFKAGSLGGGLPVRELRVSPQHGMLIDGVMVPAAALVNGVSIVREENPGDITYFHIELEGHEAVFAEGAPSETFVDNDSRAMFDNADEYNLLYGTAAARPAEQPRVEEGFQLAAIRRRLAEIAGIAAGPAAGGPATGRLERIENGVLTGWIVDTASNEAVEAEVLVDGEVVGRVVANRYRGDLDQAGFAGGRGGFSIALPASAERLEQVSLRRVIDGFVLAGPAVEATV